jgi:hypothetical protein
VLQRRKEIGVQGFAFAGVTGCFQNTSAVPILDQGEAEMPTIEEHAAADEQHRNETAEDDDFIDDELAIDQFLRKRKY